jgi:hypothetical protein
MMYAFYDTDEMEKAQRDKEKEKKKKSKAKKKERDEKEVQDAAQAQVALLEQRAVAVREGKNRQVGRVVVALMPSSYTSS